MFHNTKHNHFEKKKGNSITFCERFESAFDSKTRIHQQPYTKLTNKKKIIPERSQWTECALKLCKRLDFTVHAECLNNIQQQNVKSYAFVVWAKLTNTLNGPNEDKKKIYKIIFNQYMHTANDWRSQQTRTIYLNRNIYCNCVHVRCNKYVNCMQPSHQLTELIFDCLVLFLNSARWLCAGLYFVFVGVVDGRIYIVRTEIQTELIKN